jgi:hypothetical protein
MYCAPNRNRRSFLGPIDQAYLYLRRGTAKQAIENMRCHRDLEFDPEIVEVRVTLEVKR